MDTPTAHAVQHEPRAGFALVAGDPALGVRLPLRAEKVRCLLCAPTGRAAKLLWAYFAAIAGSEQSFDSGDRRGFFSSPFERPSKTCSYNTYGG
jgi:hypothetical protein